MSRWDCSIMSRMKVKNRSRVRKKSSMCKESRRKTWYLREDMRKSITVRTKVRRVVAGREINGVLDDLQIIAWHETRVATAVGDFGLPPPVILQADNRKDIALAKAELFGDGGIVGVHGTSCGIQIGLDTKNVLSRGDINAYRNARLVVHHG